VELLRIPRLASVISADLCLGAELMKSSANLHGEARITITSSLGYRLVSKLDYEVFTNSIPHKQSALSRMRTSLQRYNNTKLGELYLAMELDRRLREAGVENVFVNTIHPGAPSLLLLSFSFSVLTLLFLPYELKNHAILITIFPYQLGQAGKTGLGDWDHSFMSPASVKIFKRLVFLGFLLSHSTEDSAKTQTFLSASKRIPEENVHGEYWKITNSWWPTPGSWMRYTGSVKEELKPHGADKAEWKKFWGFCDEAVKKVEDDVP
jgi:NAD(P)-dependent dehydrogenase (short-subunit alcohol dehydrogenase family)